MDASGASRAGIHWLRSATLTDLVRFLLAPLLHPVRRVPISSHARATAADGVCGLDAMEVRNGYGG
jgi:hypothetical protein